MKRTLLAIAGIGLFAACTDQREPTSAGPGRIAAEISDANHGSLRNPHFFWLAPIVANVTTFNGPFNPRLSPVVQICDQLVSPCPNGHEHARFTRTIGPGGVTVGVDVAGQKYVVNWNTSSTTEPVGASFRIAVLAHDVILGFADVDIVATGKAQNANTGDDIDLVNGRTLPIKFRIEEGAIAASCTTANTQLDCAEGTASPTATTTIITGGDGAGNQAGTLIPPGALSQVVTVTIRRNLSRPCIPPPFDLPQYQGCYDLFTDPGPTTFNIGPGIDPVIVGICIEVELSRSAGAHAHIAQFDPGLPVRILPQVSAAFLNCDASDPYHSEGSFGSRGARPGNLLAFARSRMRTLLRAMLPRQLEAAHIGVGGTPPGYSTFTWTLPVTISKNAGDGQSAAAGTAVAVNPSVIARDSSNNPAQGVIVHFHALQGAVADTVDTTDVNGIASPGTWTLGGSIGQDSLVATSTGADGSPLLFTATVATFTFFQVTVGGAHSCALNGPDSAAACWGVNGDAASPSGPPIPFGQLGTFATTEMCGAFTCSTLPLGVVGGHKFLAIAAGARHTCGIEAGTFDLYCWGRGSSGQLGNGATDSSAMPVLVTGPIRAGRVTAGGLFAGHTCATDGTGMVSCWGDNGFGQLGDGTHTTRLTPVAIASTLIFTSLSAGQAHTCGVTSGGDAYCWGRNFFGQLGNGSNTDSPTPVLVSGGHSWASVSAGSEQTCAITSSSSGAGQPYCWGRNDVGQLGIANSGGSMNVPTAVATQLAFTSIGTSGFFSCGIAFGGAGYCWGRNDSGELGTGSFSTFSTCNLLPGGTVPCETIPMAVAGGHTFAALDAHGVGDHACGLAVETSGLRAYCWGRGGTGQLGNGATAASPTPVLVSGQ